MTAPRHRGVASFWRPPCCFTWRPALGSESNPLLCNRRSFPAPGQEAYAHVTPRRRGTKKAGHTWGGNSTAGHLGGGPSHFLPGPPRLGCRVATSLCRQPGQSKPMGQPACQPASQPPLMPTWSSAGRGWRLTDPPGGGGGGGLSKSVVVVERKGAGLKQRKTRLQQYHLLLLLPSLSVRPKLFRSRLSVK